MTSLTEVLGQSNQLCSTDEFSQFFLRCWPWQINPPKGKSSPAWKVQSPFCWCDSQFKTSKCHVPHSIPGKALPWGPSAFPSHPVWVGWQRDAEQPLWHTLGIRIGFGDVVWRPSPPNLPPACFRGTLDEGTVSHWMGTALAIQQVFLSSVYRTLPLKVNFPCI